MFDMIEEQNKRGEWAVEKGKDARRENPAEEQGRRLLEEALAYVMPEKEAQKACRGLLRAMGSLDGVFAAPEEALRQVPGVGEEGAGFLRLVTRLSQACLEERSWNLRRVYDTASAVELFRSRFLGRKTEAVCLMLLDSLGRVVYNDLICEGSASQVPLYLRRVLHLCIEYNVENVFLAHNHPSGAAVPSFNDMIVTGRLLTALSVIGADLCDHIILADDNYYSFLDSGMLREQELLIRGAEAKTLETLREMEKRFSGQ